MVELITGLMSPMWAQAVVEFNPHLIITDVDLTAYDSMTVGDIQKFFELNNSGLKSLKFTDTDGIERTAAEIIFAAAREAQVNPRYLLVTLQKEQSLISATRPTAKQLDWAMGFGVCDDCSMDDPALQKYKGFAHQVRRSANIMSFYKENAEQGWIKKAHVAYTIDDTTITPLSNATGFLYTYTPHIAGNKNFWRLWNQWFAKIFPDGALVQASGEKQIYVIKNGQRRPFKNRAALASRYDPRLVLTVQPTDLVAYEQGSPIALPNYSLVRTPNRTVFLLIDDVKHPIASQQVLRTLGFHPGEIDDVTDEDIATYNTGTFITKSSLYPLGVIAQERKSKQLYYIKNGVRGIIPSREMLAVNFPKKKPLLMSAQQLANIPLTLAPIQFKDGTLLTTKGSRDLYVISNGQRRRFESDMVFNNLGYKKKNVMTITEQTLTLIPEGPLLQEFVPRPLVAHR